MLLRTTTGLVGLAVLFACLWGGLPWVFLITLLAAILGIREFYRLHPPESSLPGTETAVTAPYTLPLIDDTVTDGDYANERPAHGEPVEPPPQNLSTAITGPANPACHDLPSNEATTPQPTSAQVTTVSTVGATSTDETTNLASFPEDQPAKPAPDAPDAPAAASLPALVGAVWAAAFVIGGAAANGLLHFWAISLGVFLAGGFVALLWFIAFYHGPRWPVAAAYLYGGPVYVGFLLGHVLALAQVGENFFYANPGSFDFLSFPDDSYALGRNWVLFALLATFASDTGAYLVGRAIGRHPMAPVISPNKTWEGAVGGFLGSLIAAALLERLLNLGLGTAGWTGGWTGEWADAWTSVWTQSWNWQPLLIGATVGIAAQLGDLLESRLKRLSQVKDAGGFMPGHGGILDRLDSLLITVPVVYYLLLAVLRP